MKASGTRTNKSSRSSDEPVLVPIDVFPWSDKASPGAGHKGDGQLQITAAKAAAIGEHKSQVKGTPDKGEPTETEFKSTVSAQ